MYLVMNFVDYFRCKKLVVAEGVVMLTKSDIVNRNPWDEPNAALRQEELDKYFDENVRVTAKNVAEEEERRKKEGY